MKRRRKILLIFGVSTIIGIGGFLIASRGVIPIYRLDHTRYPSETFLRTHSYLKEVERVLFSGKNDEIKIARSEKALERKSFPSLVDALIENGYIDYGSLGSVTIHKRKVTENEHDIIITDIGKESILSRPRRYMIRFRYNKQSGEVYFRTDFCNF